MEKLPGCAAPLAGSLALCQGSWIPPHVSSNLINTPHSRKIDPMLLETNIQQQAVT